MTVNNSTKHIDRHIVRTRRAIHIAFIDLLTEHEYTKITITALAKRADIDRKTSILTIRLLIAFLKMLSVSTLQRDSKDYHSTICSTILLTLLKNISMPCRQPCRSQNNNVQTCLSIFLCTIHAVWHFNCTRAASINQIKIYQPKQNAISI